MNCNLHHLAADFQEAARIALETGVDLDAPEAHAYRHLVDMVRSGTIPEALVDRAVARVLQVKAGCGLLGHGREMPAIASIHCESHVALARQAAEESVILLENRGDMLPLCAEHLRSVALIGPNSDQVQFGDYCWTKSNQHGISILRGLRELVGDKLEIKHSQGCGLVDLSKDGFAEAVDVASNSDVAIVVIGDTSSVNGGIGWEDTSIPAKGTVGETFDVSDPVPPGVQLDLVKAIHATGTPTIVIMLNGRPYSVPWIKEHVPGVILAFYPGEQQGTAIADILFGNVNPSGRLPVSIAQSAGHIPTVYDYKPSGRGTYHKPGSPEEPGRDYVFSSPDPLWAFGHGCSYTTFEYKQLILPVKQIEPDGRLLVSVDIENTGSVSGKEVVQLYVNDKVSSRTTPVMRLVAFEKVEIAAGETRKISFEIPAMEFGLWNAHMQHVVEPGEFELMVGSASDDVRLVETFSVVENSRGI
jgi:beta-glucosidase